MDHQTFMHAAYEEALKSYHQGGVPVGSVMVRNDEIISAGHNQREQEQNPIIHGEMDCFRKAGRQKTYTDTTLYTTLSPCMMCTGTILQFKVPQVVIGENVNFEGNIDFLRENGVEVILLDDPECKALMAKFIEEKPELWFEDIAEEH